MSNPASTSWDSRYSANGATFPVARSVCLMGCLPEAGKREPVARKENSIDTRVTRRSLPGSLPARQIAFDDLSNYC